MKFFKFFPLFFVLVFSLEATDKKENGLTIFFSGAVQGNFESCGCSAGPTGGLSRRAGYSAEYAGQRRVPILHVDSGNYFVGPGRLSRIINPLMEESLSRLPIEVLNLGLDDLSWWNQLQDEEFESTTIISTNLEPLRGDLRSPSKFAVVDVPIAGRGEVSIGFLGLADPRRVKPNSGFRGVDPLEAVRRVKDEVLSRADFLIVLADWIRPLETRPPEDWPLRQLAEEHEEIYLILVTERRFVFFPAVQINSAVLLSTVERGRYLGRLELGFDEDLNVTSMEPEYIELKDGVAEDGYLLEEQAKVSKRIQ